MKETQNPFPGLRPYRLSESHLFFGRKRQSQEILDKLLRHRFVSVVGNSGSGKSSLVGAGVIPLLTQQKENWIICQFRPAAHPLLSFAQALVKTFSEKRDALPEPNEVNEILATSALGLVQVLRSQVNEARPILILVDQFEELFRSEHQEVENTFRRNQQFIEALLQAIHQQDVPIHVLITLRSDFLGECEGYSGLPEAINNGQLLVPRMQRNDLRECITGPITVANKQITPRLVQQLLDELEDKQDQLPVLQHALMRTWDVWLSIGELTSPLDLPDYDQTGGLKEALSRHAEEALAELDPVDIKTLELMLKALTDASSLDRGVRRPNTVADLARITNTSEEQIKRIADVFRHPSRGFLLPTLDKPLKSDTRLDLAHESLMRVWTRLQKWVREESDSAALYRRITESALLFNEGKTGLWRDPDLQIALDWLVNNKPNEYWARQYNKHFETVRYFIQASEKEKWYENKDRKRRRLLINTSVAAALVLLSGLSLWALSERSNAQENETLALKEKRSAETQRQLAEKQTALANINFNKAKEEERKTLEQKREAEKQKQLALHQAEAARKAKARAEEGFRTAKRASQLAEDRRKAALEQKQISDSLRILADQEKEESNRLRILSLAQTIAIKSKLTKANTNNRETKALLALQAFSFNEQSGGSNMEPGILESLLSAMRAYQEKSEYVSRKHADEVLSLECSPTHDLLASAGSDGKVILERIGDQEKVKIGNQAPMVLDNLRFQADGKQLALSCDNRSVYIYRNDALSEPHRILKELHAAEITDLCWMNDGIVSIGLDDRLNVTDVITGKNLHKYKLPAKPLSLAVDVQLSLIFVGCSDGHIYKVEVGKKMLGSIFNLTQDRITSLTLSRDKKRLAVGTGNGICKLIQTADGKELLDLPGHRAGITSLDFHPTKALLASGCLDGIVRVYSLNGNTGNPIEFAEHDSWVLDVSFAHNGLILYSGSKDKTVRNYPVTAELMVNYLKNKVQRSLTSNEWNRYIGEDVPYEATLQKLND